MFWARTTFDFESFFPLQCQQEEQQADGSVFNPQPSGLDCNTLYLDYTMAYHENNSGMQSLNKYKGDTLSWIRGFKIYKVQKSKDLQRGKAQKQTTWEGQFIPSPSSAVLLFSEAQTTDLYLDLTCIVWPVPSQTLLKLALCVWAILKESWRYSTHHDRRVTHTVAEFYLAIGSWEHSFNTCPSLHVSERLFIGRRQRDLWGSEVPHTGRERCFISGQPHRGHGDIKDLYITNPCKR